MSKIICNSIDFVFVDEIDTLFSNQVNLKTGYEWKQLSVRERPVYRSEIRRNDAGPTKEETVTVVTRYDSDAILKKYSSYPVILRMKTDSDTFYVGTQQYPVITEVSDDKINDNYSFRAKSEA